MRQKLWLCFALMLVVALSGRVSLAQVSSTKKSADSATHIYEYTDEKPSFNGDFNSFLLEHLIYPDAALKDGVVSKIYIQFIVNADGSLEDIHTYRSSGSKALDEEAIRVVKLMPKWKPARNKGFPVRAYFRLPVIVDIE